MVCEKDGWSVWNISFSTSLSSLTGYREGDGLEVATVGVVIVVKTEETVDVWADLDELADVKAGMLLIDKVDENWDILEEHAAEGTRDAGGVNEGLLGSIPNARDPSLLTVVGWLGRKL